MGALSFINPIYLGALALGVLPILIHLVRRRRIRIIEWAAWDFLIRSRKQNRRRLRIEQLLLLLIRIAIILLVVMAFARPVLRLFSGPLAGANTRVHAVIVLDNSLSMAHARDGVTAFDRARKSAVSIIDRVLRRGDSVSVVLASSRPAALIRQPSFDLVGARARLRQARISDLATDYAASAALCVEILATSRDARHEVYWITDNQKTGFRQTEGGQAPDVWKRVTDTARLTWISVDQGDRPNVSLEAPRFSRELVTPQAPVRIEVQVQNRTDEELRGASVDLTVDGRPVGSTAVDVPRKGKAAASFIYLFETPGCHVGEARLSTPDDLARDNAAWFAVRVRQSLRVLVLDPRPAADAARDEAFYLATALSPTGASGGARAAIQPTVRAGSSVSGLDLRTYDVIAVAGLPVFSAADRGALEDYVRNGGGLLLFPSAQGDPGPASRSLGDGAQGTLLPARLVGRRPFDIASAPSINSASITHPALSAFRDTDEVNIGSGQMTQACELGLAGRDGTVRVNAKLTNGWPALVERSFGQGRVILTSWSAGSVGGTLPYKPAFVPMVHQLVSYLAAGPATHRNVQVGGALTARFDIRDAGKEAVVTLPRGGSRRYPTAVGADGVVLKMPSADVAGTYGVRLDRSSAPAEAFAANIAQEETDLASLSEREVRAAIDFVPVQFAGERDDIRSVVNAVRRGAEVWRGLIIAALALLFLEALLAQRFGRRS